MILTKSGGILGPIASVLGIIMDVLFHITGQFGIFNVGLCIILFTIVTKMLMLPLTIKQQKSTKLMSVMNPEIQAIQTKYKGKNDQESMRRQNVELQAVYWRTILTVMDIHSSRKPSVIISMHIT